MLFSKLKGRFTERSENGFAGILELLFVVATLLVVITIGYFAYSRRSTTSPKPTNNIASNGFKDTPECSAFNNFAKYRLSLPPDFKLKMRSYQHCGNFASFQAEPQLILLGYQSNKSFRDTKALVAYIGTWLEQNEWQKVGNSDNGFASYTTTNLKVTIRVIAYSPGTVELNLESTSKYQDYPQTNKPSPKQILLSADQQVKSAPFTAYRPTTFPYLTTPPQKTKDLSNDFEQYLGVGYYANGLSIDFSSTQIRTAQGNCGNATVPICAIWATTQKGYKIYVNPSDVNKDSLNDVTNVYFDIGDTDVSIGVDLVGKQYPITKSQVIQVVDSLEKVY